MTPRGMIPQRVNLPRVSYPGESLFYTKVLISQQNLNKKRKYLNLLISGLGWFE